MAKGRSDKRKDIELWIADTNQETLQVQSSLDKGPFSPAVPRISPPFLMSRRPTIPHFSPSLFDCDNTSSTLLKPPKPLPNARNFLSVQRSSLPLTKSHSTPPSPSYITLTQPNLSHSLDNLSIGSTVSVNQCLNEDHKNDSVTTTTDHDTFTKGHRSSSTSDPITSTSDPSAFTRDPITFTRDPITSTSDHSTCTSNSHPSTSTSEHSTFNSYPSTSTRDAITSTTDHSTSNSYPSTTTRDLSSCTSVHGASTCISNNGSTSNSVQTSSYPVITEQLLTVLSEYIIESKLSLLTTQLGLSLTDYHTAINYYRLPDTQALYILRLWYAREERTLLELINALRSAGLMDVALRLQNGLLKAGKKKKLTDSSIVNNHSPKTVPSSSFSRPYRSLGQCRGFSVQGEDGLRTVVIKKSDFSGKKEH